MAKKTITRIELLRLASGLKKARLTGHKFTYCVTLNKQEIAPKVKATQASLKPSAEYEKYQKELEEMNSKMANKDASGAPKKFRVGDNQWKYDIPGQGIDGSGWDKADKKLQETHKSAIAAQKKKVVEDEKFLEEKVEVDLALVRLAQVPADVHQDIMDGLFFMIKKPSAKELE